MFASSTDRANLSDTARICTLLPTGVGLLTNSCEGSCLILALVNDWHVSEQHNGNHSISHLEVHSRLHPSWQWVGLYKETTKLILQTP